MLLNCFAVGAGGFIGAVLRYLVGLIPVLSRGVLPYQTLLVNAAGAVLIGMIAGFCEGNVNYANLSPQTVLFLKTGVCGGFTTFSTFSLETAGLLSSDRPLAAAVYTVLSIVLCVAGVFVGKWAGEALR